MTETVEKLGGSSDGAAADQPLGAAGATGTRVGTFSQSKQLVGVGLALKPAAALAPVGYGYDTRGNRTSATPVGGATVNYGYDQANRLTNYNNGAATCGYNGDGLRMRKTVGATTTQQTWDPSSGLPLLLVDGTTNYIYGPGGLPLEQVNGSTVLYYQHDQLGSTRALTDASGNAAATYTYDAYGKLTASTGTPSAGTAVPSLGFAGQYTDPESGLQYLRARYYDPTTALFLSRDPLAGISRLPYGYAANSPVNFSDPSGLLFGIDVDLDNVDLPDIDLDDASRVGSVRISV